jgi:hypothetical protein
MNPEAEAPGFFFLFFDHSDKKLRSFFIKDLSIREKACRSHTF